MELSTLLKNIRKRWREDSESEFYGMSDREIDSALKRKTKTWELGQG